VIILEDDSFTRSTVKAALQLQDFDVIHDSDSAGSVMKIAIASKPDAVLLDLDLGTGPTGIDVAHGLRRALPKVGIVLLTGFTDPRLLDPQIAALPSGSRYIVKSKMHHVETLQKEILASISDAKLQVRGSFPVLKEGVDIPTAQLETLQLVAKGLSNSEIAKQRGISEKSVEQSISRLVAHFKLSDKEQNKRVALARVYFQLTGSVPNKSANEAI
jgi:DNA-binding NarL/FixJ family response regulator